MKKAISILVIIFSISPLFSSSIMIESGYTGDYIFSEKPEVMENNVPLKATLMLDVGNSYSLSLGAGAFFSPQGDKYSGINTGIEVDYLNYFHIGFGDVVHLRLGGGLIYTYTPMKVTGRNAFDNVLTIALALNTEVVIMSHLSLNLTAYAGYNLIDMTVFENESIATLDLGKNTMRWQIALGVGYAF